MIKRYGTEYGGWFVDSDYLTDKSAVLDAGVGEDISFIIELQKIKPKFTTWAIDPTQRAEKYVRALKLPRLHYLRAAISNTLDPVTLYKNKIQGHVSDSICSNHWSVGSSQYKIESVTIPWIKKAAESFGLSLDLVKLDVEGAEYDLIDDLIGIKQICIEFHHFCLSDKEVKDTLYCLTKIAKHGYRVLHHNRKCTEYTLLRDDG